MSAERHHGREGAEGLLRTTFACNQACRFCFVSRGGPVPMETIERDLRRLAEELGPDGILALSGGEPALDPRLPDILRVARELGLRRFMLQTNGVALARAALVGRLASLGVSHVLLAFHSHRADVYDALTASRDHYARAVEGLAAVLAETRCLVVVNVVVNALNGRELPDWVRFVGALSRAHRPVGSVPAAVYFSMMNGAGHDRAPDLGVDLAEAAPFLRAAVAACAEEGLSVAPFSGESAFPVCLLQDPGALAPSDEVPQGGIRYADRFRWGPERVGRAKHPRCRTCAFDRRCFGVPAEYAVAFGLAALGRHLDLTGVPGARMEP